ncbi:aspartic peptidase domain-containing protein [Xylariales sp. PMI_506]|nr:aspartic peptidase domain-containing protein [Xylariales sp. PMI_506]
MEMASSRLTALVALSLACTCRASGSVTRDDSAASSSKYVKFPVIHSTNQNIFPGIYSGRRDIETASLANLSDVAYYAQLSIGTPGQDNFVQLDTGSFELWVSPICSSLDTNTDVQICRAVGTYDPSLSNTSTILTTTNTLKYGIGSAAIQYVVDNIAFGDSDVTLKDVQFGVATATKDEFSGILGIGFGNNITISYPNFVDELQLQGVTDTKAFSVALGSKDEQEGVIIFGGLDTGKYAGNLQTLPIIPAADSPDGVPRYWVNMESMSISLPSGSNKTYDNSSMAVFLDTGSTLTMLPTALAADIAADFNAQGPDSNGFYLVDCDYNSQLGSVNFAFAGVTIQVPFSEIIREVATSFGTQCYMGISPSSEFVLLGDTMMRSAFAVFDLTNEAIHLAQYVNCGTNEVEITASTNLTGMAGQCDAPNFLAASSTSSTTDSIPTVTVTAGTGGATSTGKASGAVSSLPSGPLGLLSAWVATMLAMGFIVCL